MNPMETGDLCDGLRFVEQVFRCPQRARASDFAPLRNGETEQARPMRSRLSVSKNLLTR